MFTLVSFSLPRTTVIFGGENEEQHWLQTCSGRGTEWGRSFDIPWNGTIYSYHQLHPSTTFPAFPRLLEELCTSCGSCVRSRGSLAMKASYKAQSKLQKIILWSVGLVSVVPVTFLATMRCKRSGLLPPCPRFGSANNEADKQLRNLPEARCECNC